MAQVINPNVPKDNSLDTIVNGLRIYSAVQDMRGRNGMPQSMVSSGTDMDAMQRRLDSLNYQYADSLDKGRV